MKNKVNKNLSHPSLHCLDCSHADVIYGDQYITIFCQKRMQNIHILSDECGDFVQGDGSFKLPNP